VDAAFDVSAYVFRIRAHIEDGGLASLDRGYGFLRGDELREAVHVVECSEGRHLNWIVCAGVGWGVRKVEFGDILKGESGAHRKRKHVDALLNPFFPNACAPKILPSAFA